MNGGPVFPGTILGYFGLIKHFLAEFLLFTIILFITLVKKHSRKIFLFFVLFLFFCFVFVFSSNFQNCTPWRNDQNLIVPVLRERKNPTMAATINNNRTTAPDWTAAQHFTGTKSSPKILPLLKHKNVKPAWRPPNPCNPILKRTNLIKSIHHDETKKRWAQPQTSIRHQPTDQSFMSEPS